MRKWDLRFFEDVKAHACIRLKAIDDYMHKVRGLASGSEMADEKVEFGCTLGCECVRKTKTLEEAWAKHYAAGGASGISSSLKDERNHWSLNRVNLGGRETAYGEWVADTFVEYARVIEPRGVRAARAECKDSAKGVCFFK